MCNLNNFCITYIETPYNKNKDEKNGRGWCKGVPLLRIGRRIAPCLLCVVTCAVCQMLRYAPQQAQALRFGSVQVLRTSLANHTGRHYAIPLCQYSAAHVHFAPTPDYQLSEKSPISNANMIKLKRSITIDITSINTTSTISENGVQNGEP